MMVELIEQLLGQDIELLSDILLFVVISMTCYPFYSTASQNRKASMELDTHVLWFDKLPCTP